MGTVDQQRAGRTNEGRIDIGDFQRHVGAVLAVEDQRKSIRVADAQEHQRGEALGVFQHALRGHAFAPQLFTDEAAEVVRTHTGQQATAQAQARGTDRGVGGTAADIFGERHHVFQSPAHLFSVQVDA